jgi:hypothetical protein
VPFGRDSHCSETDLSAYLDAQLASDSRQRCDAHLAACAECRDALESLSAVRSSLRALPRATAPRSFRLRQAQAEVIRSRQPAFIVRVMPQLSGLSAVSLVAFLLLVAVNVTGGVDLGTSSNSKSASSVMSAGQETAADSPVPEFSDNVAGPGTVSPPSAAISATPYAPAPESTIGQDGSLNSADQNADKAARTAAALPAPVGTITSSDNGNSDTAMHIAEAVAAAIALASGGLAFAAYRRTR